MDNYNLLGKIAEGISIFTGLSSYTHEFTLSEVQRVFNKSEIETFDGKVQHQWIFLDGKQRVFTVYNYCDNVDDNKPYKWHVGCHMHGKPYVEDFVKWFNEKVKGGQCD